ncbi:MAG: HAMP domain-containing histidine kinase [Tissierellales bacterium]|nr:HAMP domain-containing histidine kinase [Tissierellales bacterium]
MKNKYSQKSYFNTLVRDFLYFVIATLISILAILFLRDYIEDVSMRTYLQYTYDNVPEEIKSGEYLEFESEHILGDDGFFEIIDSDGNIVYSHLKNKQIQFSADEIKLIPNESNRPIVTRESYKDFDSNEYVELTFEYYEDLKKTYQKILIVDRNYRLVFSDMHLDKDTFSKKELELMMGIYENDYEISKLEFEDNSKNPHSIIFFRKHNPMNRISTSIKGNIKYYVAVFIVLFMAYAIIYLVKLDKKVKTPLHLLGDAIDRIAKGEKEEQINYRGPNEFEELCQKFNDMSRKLSESEEKQRELEKEKKRIIADISHDLKTPITIVQGFAQMLIDGKINESERKTYLERISQKSDSMAKLINALSEYSKLDHPEFRLDIENRNMSEFARQYFIEKYSELEMQGYKLDIDIPDNDIYCKFDEFEIKRVFDNIISNTVKYTEKERTISFSIEKTNQNIKLKIGDNGRGISSELQSKIFEPFSIEDEARTTRSGSGLGMAIAYKIIKAHRGDIKLTSDDKKQINTLYEIELPAK